MKIPSIYDIPQCNRLPNQKEQLERILKAQILLCEWEGTNPDEEPYIQHLRKELEKL